MKTKYYDHLKHIIGENNMAGESRKILRSWLEIQKSRDTFINAHGDILPISFDSVFIDDELWKKYNDIITIIQEILVKVTHQYLEDETYRALFGFGKDMEELILMPCQYEELIPLGRYDLFFGDGDFKFCEFNTDGSGGMSRQDIVSEKMLSLAEYRRFGESYPLSKTDVVGAFVDHIKDIYFATPDPKATPVFAIVDFPEEINTSDGILFEKKFIKAGVNARFTPMDDLFFDGEHLWDSRDDTIIDCVYRRAVTGSILKYPQRSQPLIEAVKGEKVILIGHFRTSVAASKRINILLHRRETKAFLSATEIDFVEKHIPKTYIIDDALPHSVKDSVLNHKNDWIIKPDEGFASEGVVAGRDVSREEWISLLNDRRNQNYIIQEYCFPGTIKLLYEGDDFEDWEMMYGLYQIGGKFAGMFNRAGHKGVIDLYNGGIMVPALRVGKAWFGAI